MTGSVRYCIKHTSCYVYSSPVSKSAMTLCFRPREDDGQSLLSCRDRDYSRHLDLPPRPTISGT